MQIAWQNGLTDLAMPFMIQFMKDYVGKVDTLMADRKENMEARKVGLLSRPVLHYHNAPGLQAYLSTFSTELRSNVVIPSDHPKLSLPNARLKWDILHQSALMVCRMLTVNRRSSKRKAMLTSI